MPNPMPGEQSDPARQETARIVLALDAAITAFRAGALTGLRALDAASRLSSDLASDAIARAKRHRRGAGRPDRVELAILTALADTYGAEILTNASLGYALRLVARHGGVALVQRMLWGDTASDTQLAVMLAAAQAAFTQISLAFPDAFLAEANDVLAGFRPRPPGPSSSGEGGPRE
jgi:hypothetical protein